MIRPLERRDFANGFAETLSALAAVDLDRPRLQAVLDLRRRRGVQTFVYLDGDRVVGTASLVVEPKFIHAGGKVGHLEDVAVLPGYRKAGIGRKLVTHVIKEARRHGCYKVILNCTDRLEGFYSAAGFRTHTTGMRLDLDVSSSAVAEPA
jgi:glucosamine-phosphate N-acetyltransferase